MKSFMRICIPLFLILLSMVITEASEQKTLFQEAVKTYQAADHYMLSDPTLSRSLYRDAALLFEKLAQVSQDNLGVLHYNAGVSWHLADEDGKALYHYHEAKEYLPNNLALEENVMSLRNQLLDQFPDQDIGLNWIAEKMEKYLGPISIRLWVVLLLQVALCMSYLYIKFKGTQKFPFSIQAILSLVALVSLVYVFSLFLKRTEADGVIIANEVTARKGPGLIYENAYFGNLHAGTEFKLNEIGAGWTKIILKDNTSVWIPSKTLKLYLNK